MGKWQTLYNSIASDLSKQNNIEISQMFGKPCLKADGKAFCCLFQDEMVFKLDGDAHKKAIALKGAQLFDPSGKGRAMKSWVQIPVTHNANWKSFAATALKQLLSPATKQKL